MATIVIFKADFAEDDGDLGVLVVLVHVGVSERGEEFFLCRLRGEAVFLGEVADLDAAAGFEGAFVGLFAAGEDFEESGFARTVGAEHTAAFAFVEAEGDAFKEFA